MSHPQIPMIPNIMWLGNYGKGHPDVKHVYDPQTNITIKFEIPGFYGFFFRYGLDKILSFKLLQQGQGSTQDHTMKMPIYTPQIYSCTMHEFPTSYNFWDLA